MPIRTFSPMIARTETSISSPIMMLWLDFRVRTSMNASALSLTRPPAPPPSPSPWWKSVQRALYGRAQPRLVVLPPFMARRSLKPQLNQIRTWVRQGRTDAWIAHQLDVSARDIKEFKREHELVPAEQLEDAPDDPFGARVAEEEPDLRAEDDALVAAALDAEPEDAEEADEDASEDDADKPRRRRGRRGGRGRRRGQPKELEGTFDHGDEGYGLWLDPAVQDDPLYAEHWAGHRPVTVTIEQDQIVIRRSGEENGGGPSSKDDADGGSSADTSETDALDPDEFDT